MSLNSTLTSVKDWISWSKSSRPTYDHLDPEESDEGNLISEGKSSLVNHSLEEASYTRKYGLIFLSVTSIIIALAVAFALGQHSARNDFQSYLPKSDAIWGNVPLKKVRFVDDDRFKMTDPTTGRFFANKNGTWTIWDEIHRGSWVQLLPSEQLGITGGLPLNLYSANGSWPNGKEGYVPAVLHQIHCLGVMNHFKIEWTNGSIPSEDELEHMEHCIEYIRHAVMCYGDTTLEKPVDHSNFVRVDYQGVEHVCRDWSVLADRFWESSIDFIWGTERPMTVFENTDAARGNPDGPIPTAIGEVSQN
ncbi:hypothetical protein N7468_009132 [Penicillium chermesinum]|uniref:Tat pathway signal sequence n=1 Tax=Penicillium chermesinum TaxID=63820 RepID=A0A9W9NHL0_9EURO|nr:uncharacterized protein N7468_009132 [Penicillium chermesinum]KAJ5219928.1 hypothetical protein N7468_009132 [Penicillium chermesinum]KAJ6157387.1 hypothetical protein N7470_004979 [Penicillium chermesinum]